MARVRSSVTVKDGPALAGLRSMLDLLSGAEVWVGIAGTPGNEEANEIVQYATANEFGMRRAGVRIPERSFMRSTFDARLNQTHNLISRMLARASNAPQVLREMDLIGVTHVGWIRQTIAAGVPPANSPETIERKGSSRTLIDTGRMFQSLAHQVVPGAGKVNL